MDNLELPIYSWFIGDMYSKSGNRFTGSVNAYSLWNNCFCYIVWLDKSTDKPILKCECYESINKNNLDEHLFVEYEGSDNGRDELKKWLDEQYGVFVKSGRNKLTIEI